MQSSIEPREHLGKRLGEITREVREAKRIAEERAKAARIQAEREELVRVRGEALFQLCGDQAEEAAHQGDAFIVRVLGAEYSDVLPVHGSLHDDLVQWVVNEFVRCGCRAHFMMGDAIRVEWDVPPIMQTDEVNEPADMRTPDMPTTVMVQLLQKEPLEPPMKHGCKLCSEKHPESGMEDRVLCYCECHVFSGTRLSPVPT
jgi:hypothetical protein